MKNKKFRVTRRVRELAIYMTIRGRITGNKTSGYFVTQQFTKFSSKFLILILMAVEPSKASISRKIFQISKKQEISYNQSKNVSKLSKILNLNLNLKKTVSK